MADVFISYSHQDRAAVDAIANALNSMGVSVWRDQDIRAGSNWVEEIERGLHDAKVLVLCLSPNFLASDWANVEIGVAITRSREGTARVVPVLMRDTVVPPLLSLFQHLDARNLQVQQIASRLRDIVNETRAAKPAPAADA